MIINLFATKLKMFHISLLTNTHFFQHYLLHVVDDFLYSLHLSACQCIDTVGRNKVMITLG